LKDVYSKVLQYEKIDRDYNAALNIIKLGLEKLPQELQESTPVEMEQTLSLKQEAPCEG